MPDFLMYSYFVLWVLVIALTFFVLVLYRQVGEMYLGGKQGRTRDGILVGHEVPRFHATDLAGRTVEMPLGRSTLLVFAMPDCAPCRALMPDLARFARLQMPELSTVIVAGANDALNGEFGAVAGPDVAVLGQRDLVITTKYRVRSTPFAFYLDASGTVRAKGITNRFGDLEELVSRGRANEPTQGEPARAIAEGSAQ
jgi:methylamine dehydrogenase accessory protein MauD